MIRKILDQEQLFVLFKILLVIGFILLLLIYSINSLIILYLIVIVQYTLLIILIFLMNTNIYLYQYQITLK